MFGVPDGATIPREPTLDEINAKVPKRVRLSDDGRGSVWVVIIFLVGGLIWLGGFSHYLFHRWQIHNAVERGGLEAPGRIKSRSHSRSGNSAVYAFQVDGVNYENSASDFGATGDDRVGSRITVLYLPSNPSESYPKGWQWSDWLYPTFCFLLVGGVAVHLGAMGAWSLYRDHRLARNGWVTEGTVTLCLPKKNTGKFMVDYEFRTDRDQLVEGSNNDCPDEYKTDAKIRVIYLRHHPQRNDTYPVDSYQMPENRPPDVRSWPSV
jgi:hypothetical protein